MRRIAGFIISLSVFSLALCAVPARAAEADVVSSREELQAWVDAHMETGGRVELLCPVTLDASLTPSSYSDSLPSITVDTGAFGLIYDGGTLADLPNVAVVGEGVDMPVVDIRYAPVFMGVDTTLQNLNVTAAGRGGAGGTAVRMAQEISGDPGGFFGGGRGVIRSCGAGAVGLRLDAPGEIRGLTIAVEGENSIAALSAQGNTLSFCRLSAAGVNARVADGPQITLDTCSSSPEASGCAVVTRRIAGVLGESLYLPIKQSNEAPALDGTSWVDLLLRDQQGVLSFCAAAIDWELSAMDGFDPSHVGTTMIPGSLPTAMQGFGLEQGFPLVRTLQVRDAALPCVTTTNRMEEYDSGRPYIAVRTAYREDLVPGYIFWRSDDGGATWRDCTNAPEVKWADVHQPDNVVFELLWFYLDDVDADVLLQLELPGVGESNLVLLSASDGTFFSGPGGDRDGGDRVIAGQPPVDSSAAPSENNEPVDDAEPPTPAPSAAGTPAGEGSAFAAAGGASPAPAAQQAPEMENGATSGETAVSPPRDTAETASGAAAEAKDTMPGGTAGQAAVQQAGGPAQRMRSRFSTWLLPAAAAAFAAVVTVAAWLKMRVKR